MTSNHMQKILFFLLCIAFQFLGAQNMVSGKFTDQNSVKDVALYRIIDGNPDYIKYTNVESKQFSFSMEGLPKGVYRVLYQNIKTGYVDFIYNHELVNFTINSSEGQSSVEFLASKENQLLQAYQYSVGQLQNKLDSVQISYFKNPKTSRSKYQEIKEKVDGAQQYYEELAKEYYCLSFIKASRRHNAPLPFYLPDEYLNHIIKSFLEGLDFQNLILRNSMFIKKRLNTYVFYLHQVEAIDQQNELYLRAIEKILAKTKEDVFKEHVLRWFMTVFLKKQNSEVLSSLINLYKTIPEEFRNKTLLSTIEIQSKTMVGQIAPDFKISDQESLHSLEGNNNYLIIFWSSECPHCSEELPRVEEITNNHKNTTVITIALENESSLANWREIIKAQYKDWKNIVALGKWDSKEAIVYDIHATPSYFLLDENKQIIGKPHDFSAVREMLK